MTTPMTASRLALFDLDHTLLPMDSDYQWADFLARTGRAGDPEQARARNDELMHQYNEGVLTAQEAAEFMLGLLAAHSPVELARFHDEFMREVVWPAITEQAVNLVHAHQEAGDLCAIVTATNTFVTAPIARAFGIQHLIATDPQYVQGRYTGKIEGIPSFQAGKITRVNAWLEGLGRQMSDYETVYFYSDSVNDLPLLEVVSNPIATNPSDSLRKIAQERQWTILDLFHEQADQKS